MLNKLKNEDEDAFVFLKLRFGEWKTIETHLLPLLMYLHSDTVTNAAEFCAILELIHLIVEEIEEPEPEGRKKPKGISYGPDLKHYSWIYKRHFSHERLMSSLLTSIIHCMKSDIM